jgi:hypothetical protein
MKIRKCVVKKYYFRCFGSRAVFSLLLCRDPGLETGSSVCVKSVLYVNRLGLWLLCLIALVAAAAAVE